jgi:hypothetical protein
MEREKIGGALIPHQFLHMNLADKVPLQGRDNDGFIIMVKTWVVVISFNC